MDDQRIDSAGSRVRQEIKQPWYALDIGAEIARVADRFRFSLKSLLMAVTVLALVASAYWAGRDRGFRYGQISGAKDADSKWQAVQQAAEVKHREEMDQERQRSHDWVQAGHKDAEEYITNRAIQLQQFYGRLIPRTNQETKK